VGDGANERLVKKGYNGQMIQVTLTEADNRVERGNCSKSREKKLLKIEREVQLLKSYKVGY
jgi:hypothetical protein